MRPEERQPLKIPLSFFRLGDGREPVRDWLKGLPEEERQAIRRDLLRAQWRWPVGMPLCRAMGRGLWEIRTDLPTKRTARVLLSPQKSSGGTAWFHQEDAQDSRPGFRVGTKAKGGT